MNSDKTRIPQNYRVQNNRPFQFLPGHKKIILSIPSPIQQIVAEAEVPSPAKQKKMNAGRPSPAQQHKKGIELRGKRKPAKKKLKSDLVTEMQIFVVSIGLERRCEGMTESNVIDFKTGTDSKFEYECRFKCPFCQKPQSVKYEKGKWITYNIKSHFKRQHSKEEGEPCKDWKESH